MKKKPFISQHTRLFLFLYVLILGMIGTKYLEWSFLPKLQLYEKPASYSQNNDFPKSNPKRSFIKEQEVTSRKLIPQETEVPNTNPWGVAKQLSEHTWTMKVGQDDRMATPLEILDAVNTYRARHQSNALSWSDTLANYAQSRTDFFWSKKTTDEHAGFIDYLENQDGFKKLGFISVGENSSIGFRLYGVHLIEWVYAGDEPHNKNQLNPKWTHVGIGVTGTATDLIFATDPF